MLEIKSLYKKYKKKSPFVLYDISLKVAEGERVAVLGPSGAGKTTLLRCLNQIHLPSKGDIVFAGKQVNKLRGKTLSLTRCQLGMIFQNFGLVPRHSVVENVMMGRLGYQSLWRSLLFRFTEKDNQMALEALNKVGLSDFADKRVEELSGGQRQRVAIARALMQRPKLILADEPVASLDPHTAKSVMGILRKLNQEENITMIVNLHTVELAKEFATRVIGMTEGEITFDGKPEELSDEILAKIYQGNTIGQKDNEESLEGGIGCSQESQSVKSCCG